MRCIGTLNCQRIRQLTLQCSQYTSSLQLPVSNRYRLISLRHNISSNRHTQAARPQASGREEPDIAVLRFTLGIPGFDDGLLPRVIGFAGLLILIINAIAGRSAGEGSQVRAEVIGCVLAGLCIAVPAISKQLEENATGKGRKGKAAVVDGSIQLFKLADGLEDSVKQELAWSTYALLKNTNTAGVLVCADGAVLAARGALRQCPSETILQTLEQSLQGSKLLAEDGGSMAWSDQDSLRQSGLLGALPDGVQSCIVVPGQSSKTGRRLTVLSYSGLQSAFSKRDRQWTAHIAEKLAEACPVKALTPS